MGGELISGEVLGPEMLTISPIIGATSIVRNHVMSELIFSSCLLYISAMEEQ